MSESTGAEWQPVEVYSTFLRIRGEMLIQPPLRLSDEVNRLLDYLQLRNTTTEPLLATYPMVSPTEPNTTIEKASVVMILPGGEQAGQNRMMWRGKGCPHGVLNNHPLSSAR